MLPKNTTPSKLSKETADDYDIAASPGRVVEAKTDNSQIGSSNGTGSCKLTANQILREKRDAKKADSSARYQRNGNAASSMDRLGFDNGACGSVSPLRHTPTYDRDIAGNGTQYRNNGTREK